MVEALRAVEMQSVDPFDLARHWGRIIGIPASESPGGDAEIALVNCTFRFVRGGGDAMTGLTFRVADVASVRDAAKAKAKGG